MSIFKGIRTGYMGKHEPSGEYKESLNKMLDMVSTPVVEKAKDAVFTVSKEFFWRYLIIPLLTATLIGFCIGAIVGYLIA